MALFTDGNITSVDELQAYDTSIVSIASAEGVDLAAKMELARTELGIELAEFLAKRTTATGGLGAGIGLENVVVTPALKHWHALLTLALVYGDIQGNHLESRYGAKWKDYRARERRAADSLLRSGVGVVSNPIPRALPPLVRTVAAPVSGETYYIRIAWRGARGDSGEASEACIHTVETNGVPGVRADRIPEDAAGFDVYAGLRADLATKQNDDPLDPSAEWTMPVQGLREGDTPPAGQQPGWHVRNDRVLLRG